MHEHEYNCLQNPTENRIHWKYMLGLHSLNKSEEGKRSCVQMPLWVCPRSVENMEDLSRKEAQTLREKL